MEHFIFGSTGSFFDLALTEHWKDPQQKFFKVVWVKKNNDFINKFSKMLFSVCAAIKLRFLDIENRKMLPIGKITRHV